MSDSVSSSPSVVSSDLDMISFTDAESPNDTASQGSDSDYEVVLVAQATSVLSISDSDSDTSGLVSAPSDSLDSDDEHIFVPNPTQSAPNTPRPAPLVPSHLGSLSQSTPTSTPRPIVETGHGSDTSDREVELSNDNSHESGSDADAVSVTNGRPAVPTTLGTAHPNTSAATIRAPALVQHASSSTPYRSRPAVTHTPPITTNSIMNMTLAAPLSPPTPSDDGEIPYAPFTAALNAIAVPVVPPPVAASALPTARACRPTAPSPAPPVAQAPRNMERVPPPIPSGMPSQRVWTKMNLERIALGLRTLAHPRRAAKQREREQAEAQARAERQRQQAETVAAQQARALAQTAERRPRRRGGSRAVTPAPAPAWTVGASPVSSEDEAPRIRASMFSPVDDISVRSDSPDEEAYETAIKQIGDHLQSPPEKPTAAYRYILNRALLLEFHVCTPETLPTSHGAAIALVKTHIHINVIDYVAKREGGFQALHSAMLESAKALKKDIRKRKMPVTKIKSMGLHSLLIHH